MHIQHNYMRMHRKKARLSQSDIAHLASLSDHSNVSRWENGTREPSLETLIVYNLLFDTPIELIFKRQKEELEAHICGRIASRIEALRAMPQNRKIGYRIAYLELVFNRLTAPKAPRE